MAGRGYLVRSYLRLVMRTLRRLIAGNPHSMMDENMAEMNDMPEAGQQAPAFQGVTQDGKTIRLSDFKGRKLALFFYPEDDTPNCTVQACTLRDDYQALLRAGIAVVGVSPDDVDSHARYAAKFDLPFPLIADPNRAILNSYGVWGEKNMYGHKFMGVKRTTFLIDESGAITAVLKRPKIREHAQEILEKFGLGANS
jgi:thioredoxin-dependent peroxiredoxin